MGQITDIPHRLLNGSAVSSATTITVYEAATSTLVSLFSDEGLTSPIPNPLTVTSGNPIPALYYGFDGEIRVAAIDGSGPIFDDDPYDRPASANALASAGGGVMVGIAEDGEGMALKSADFFVKQGSVSLLAAEGAAGDDDTDNVTAFGNAAAEASTNGRGLLIPKGRFRLASVGSIPAGGLVIEGRGEDSVLKVGSSNQVLLRAIAGGKIVLHRVRLIGDRTASSSANGMGLYLTSFGDLLLDDVVFQDFGFAAVHVAESAALREKIEFRNIKCLGGTNAANGANADLLIYGVAEKMVFENLYGEADSSDPCANLIAVAQTGASRQWQDLSIRGLKAFGYANRGISIANENPTSDFQSGKVSLHDVKIFDTGWSGLKTKNIDFVQLSDIYVENADSDGPEIAGNLQGAILINGANSSQCTNIIVNGSGTDGLRYVGRAAGSSSTGVGKARHVVNGLDVSRCNGSGLYVSANVESMIVNGLVAYDVANAGVRINGSAGLAAPRDIHINSPIVRRTGGHSAGILIQGLSGMNIGTVYIHNPNIALTGGYGLQAQYCDYLEVNGGSIYDSGQGAVNTYGMSLANIAYAKVMGVTSTNRSGSTQTYAMRLAGGITTAMVDGNDFSGNTTGSVLYTAPTTIRAFNNRGWLEAMAMVDPASMEAGASTTPATITVPGAAVGDFVEASFSNNIAGAQLIAWVTSAHTVGYYFTNANGGDPLDLASGTLSVRVRK